MEQKKRQEEPTLRKNKKESDFIQLPSQWGGGRGRKRRCDNNWSPYTEDVMRTDLSEKVRADATVYARAPRARTWKQAGVTGAQCKQKISLKETGLSSQRKTSVLHHVLNPPHVFHPYLCSPFSPRCLQHSSWWTCSLPQVALPIHPSQQSQRYLTGYKCSRAPCSSQRSQVLDS